MGRHPLTSWQPVCSGNMGVVCSTTVDGAAVDDPDVDNDDADDDGEDASLLAVTNVVAVGGFLLPGAGVGATDPCPLPVPAFGVPLPVPVSVLGGAAVGKGVLLGGYVLHHGRMGRGVVVTPLVCDWGVLALVLVLRVVLRVVLVLVVLVAVSLGAMVYAVRGVVRGAVLPCPPPTVVVGAGAAVVAVAGGGCGMRVVGRFVVVKRLPAPPLFHATLSV